MHLEPLDMQRRVLADRLLEQARAAGNDSPDDSIILQSLELDPGWMNAYVLLARRWKRRYVLSGPALQTRIEQVWAEVGKRDPRALRFIKELVACDAFQLDERLLDTLPETALILWMNDELDGLDLLEYERRQEGDRLAFLGRVHGPQLMCSLRDFTDFPPVKRAVIEDLIKLGKGHRVVIHGSTCVTTSPKVFGPAIDTMYFAKVLRKHVLPLLGAAPRVVCELGVGSGFLLSSLLAEFGGSGATFLASDVSKDAIALTLHNIERTRARLRGRFALPEPIVEVVHTDNLLRRIADSSVDLLITNPPYIPGYRASAPNAYEGTTIIEDLLLGDGPRVLSQSGVMVLLYSSLSTHIVESYLKKTPLVGFPVGEPLRVPLDLREVLGDPLWMQQLCDRGLEEDMDSPHYGFWHKIQMACFVHPAHPLAQRLSDER